MSIPDFDRADYPNALPPSSYTDALPPSPYTTPAPPAYAQAIQASPNADPFAATPSYFGKSLLFGTVAAIAGALGYGLIGLSGWMVAIVAIGVGWLVAKAIMTGSQGIGGRKYQITAILLTYFACSTGDLLDYIWLGHADFAAHHAIYVAIFSAITVLLGPFLALSNPFNGALGLIILWVGMRTAWRLAAGSPGFGSNTPAPPVTPFG